MYLRTFCHWLILTANHAHLLLAYLLQIFSPYHTNVTDFVKQSDTVTTESQQWIHFESWFLVCPSQVSSWCCDSACWTGCRNRLVALVLAAAAADLPGSTCFRLRRRVKWTKMQKPDFECKNTASMPPVMEELEVDQDVSPGGLFRWNVTVRCGNCRRIWATAKISYVS